MEKYFIKNSQEIGLKNKVDGEFNFGLPPFKDKDFAVFQKFFCSQADKIARYPSGLNLLVKFAALLIL